MKSLTAKQTIITAFISVILGCSTPYQPQPGNSRGGYYEQKFSEDTYFIGFSANAHSDSEQVIAYTLLRAAEFGQQNGYTHFSIIAYQDLTSTELGINPGTVYNYSTGTYSSFPIMTKTKYPQYQIMVKYEVVFPQKPISTGCMEGGDGGYPRLCEINAVISIIKSAYHIEQ